jgi:mRNA interferase RelE/StbE
VTPRSLKLRLTVEIAGVLRNLHPHLKKKLRESFRIILSDPLSGKALKDELDGLRSFRVGTFRIIYRIVRGQIIEIVAIGPRKHIYEETFRLLKKKVKRPL